MFKRKKKTLKQLQDVQAQIKNCKSSIEALKPPTPESMKVKSQMWHWLETLALGHRLEVDEVFMGRSANLNNDTLDYIHKLGEYFVNIAEWQKSSRKLHGELECLQVKERALKNQLGID